ncbi:RebB family R body protein [Reichenbachiella versicolor]|uniref:RebB family R body protein n=1 Tax=Reichenbachiella versicolor TaxID=1821036 RepID=UPI000D6E5FD5|nr:RebB family R body protein [Reichenbachiella versicolor]
MQKSTVNAQVTDSLTETNTLVVGQAPSVAVSTLYQATAQAMGNAAHNSTVIQQQGSIVAQAVGAQAVNLVYSIKF